MRTVSAVVATLSLAASGTIAGCSFSTVDPDAAVTVAGTALGADGKPLADAKVLLFKQADLGGVIFGGIFALGSLGTICLLPDAPAVCGKAKTASTDSDGRYRFDLTGEDTQGTLGTEATLNVVFSGSGKDGSTTVSFTVKDTDVRLPDARLVRLAPRVSRPGGRIKVSWTRVPGDAGSKPAYSAQLYEGRNESALWSQPASGRAAALDPRLLEDRAGTVAVGAKATLSGGSGTGSVQGYYLSPKLKVTATAGAPPSRGKRCASVLGSAPAKNGPFSRCAATDGDLDSPARLAGGTVSGAVVDLGSVRPVSLIVARGFAGQVVAEVSTDGRSYTKVATSAGNAVALTVPGSQRARYVRLRSPTGLNESLAAELSVW